MQPPLLLSRRSATYCYLFFFAHKCSRLHQGFTVIPIDRIYVVAMADNYQITVAGDIVAAVNNLPSSSTVYAGTSWNSNLYPLFISRPKFFNHFALNRPLKTLSVRSS